MPNLEFAVCYLKKARAVRVGTAAVIGGLLIGLGAGEPAKAAVDVVCGQRFTVQDDGDCLELAYCGNVDLGLVE